MNHEFRAYAPASIGNVSVGFDCLGLCLEAPGDIVSVRATPEAGKVFIHRIEGDSGLLPRDSSLNVAGVVAEKMLAQCSDNIGVEIDIRKGLPLKSGMGSSAASSVASALALNALLGYPFRKEDLLSFILEGERLAGGTAHADNAAPCLLGGIRLVFPGEPVRTISLAYPKSLTVALVHPHVDVATREAREILPAQVPLSVAVKQAAYLAAFIHALQHEDWDLIADAMCDLLAEPARSTLIPAYSEVKDAALRNGALNCGISGSGPSLFALCRNRKNAELCAGAMADIYKQRNIDCEHYISGINTGGAKILTI
jgi:homoserine kinase